MVSHSAFKLMNSLFEFHPSYNSIKIFALKAGLASAAVYYVKEQGVWKKSNESVKSYEKLKETVHPYIQDVKSIIPVEFPELPETETLSSLAKESWNRSVMATFKFLSDLPETVSDWTDRGIDYAMQNEEVKRLIESFSNK